MCVISWLLVCIYSTSEQYKRAAFISRGKDVRTIFCVASRHYETKAVEGKRESTSVCVRVYISVYVFCPLYMLRSGREAAAHPPSKRR